MPELQTDLLNGFPLNNDVTPLKRAPTENDLIGRYQLNDERRVVLNGLLSTRLVSIS